MEEKEFDYINIVPLVDVMLVLLTIVLMTSTFIAMGGIPLELPKASKAFRETAKMQSIEIDRNGGIYLNAKPLPLSDLRAALDSADRGTPILVRADRNIPLQTFVNVLDIVKGLDFSKVSLQTEDRR
ncbi:MAG: biopolymer transporter ExbD [Pseudomonadota bacterium]